MPDSQAQRAKKRPFDLDDIMSMLGEERKGTPEQAPEKEPAAPAKPEPEIKVIKTESSIVEPQNPAPAAQPDSAIVDRLLADFTAKNEEILRLNNELTQLRFEVKEKEQKIIALTSIGALLDEKDEAIRSKDAIIRDKEESIKDKEASIKEKEAALKEKDALLKEKETLLKDLELALAAKDAEAKLYETRVRELEAKIDEMAEQLGTIRKLSARESAHEPFVEEPVTAEPAWEQQEMNIQESMAAEEDDVGAIFRRLAEARAEEPAEGEEGQEKPRKPRSAKLYDL